MSVRIRFATPLDDATIEAIENSADRLFIDRFAPEQWLPAPSGASRTSEHGFVLVAEAGQAGTVVGFAQVIEADGIAHLEQLSVSPEHGRRGYGSRLVEAAKAEARRRGYARLTLRTYADLPWNAPFYARLGFIEEEPVADFHRRLIEAEGRLGLATYGRRVRMAAVLL